MSISIVLVQAIPVNSIVNVGFEVFTAVVMKSVFFWDMTPCSPLATRRHIPEDATLQHWQCLKSGKI
jgi:hypothetical protein